MSDIVNVVLLGIIEGITEFLPISSTGHLLIAEHWLGQRSDTFNIVIQAGAMLAVTIVYWRRLLALGLHIREPENRNYALKLVLAFLITAVLGLAVKRWDSTSPKPWRRWPGHWSSVACGSSRQSGGRSGNSPKQRSAGRLQLP